MSKLISFSVWGDQLKYLDGSIENVHLARKIYPGWDVRFYCDSKTPDFFRNQLKSIGAEVVVKYTVANAWEGLFWRFLPASEKNIEVFISRDIDSRINVRERAAVDEWLKSDRLLHCMRDHIEHNVPMLGGMWGCRSGLIGDIGSDIQEWDKFGYKGSDQDFLREIVWNNCREYAMVHDKYWNGLVLEQVVTDVHEYYRQRKEFVKYIEQLANDPYRTEPLPVLEDVRMAPNGDILQDYVYKPKVLFGDHDVRPFPKHEPMEHGSYVGEIINVGSI